MKILMNINLFINHSKPYSDCKEKQLVVSSCWASTKIITVLCSYSPIFSLSKHEFCSINCWNPFFHSFKGEKLTFARVFVDLFTALDSWNGLPLHSFLSTDVTATMYEDSACYKHVYNDIYVWQTKVLLVIIEESLRVAYVPCDLFLTCGEFFLKNPSPFPY